MFRRSTLLYIALLLLVFVFGWQAAYYYQLQEQEDERIVVVAPDALEEETDGTVVKADLKTFWEAWGILERDYVENDKLDEQEMVYGATKGMVASLGDEYTVYMTPEETEEFHKSLDGKLEGIGAELTVENKNLVVVSPLRNSPAARAGLLPGDIIYKIEGEIAAEMTLFDAITAIRGEKGTEVTLTIIRESVENPFDVTIVRESIDIESVTWEEKGDIALVTINQFNDKTKPEFQNAISEILLAQMRGVIIDLRYNGGGYLDIAVDILSDIVPGKEKVVSIKRRDEATNESIYVGDEARLTDIPLAILINNGSASASEIVAGAVQDYDLGMVIGEQSFGKGTVQELATLSDGSSIRLTVAKWLTAADRDIDKVGITPDIAVERSDEDFENGDDPQLDRAIEWIRSQ